MRNLRVKLMEAESRMLVSRGFVRGKWRGICQRVLSFHLCQMKSPRDLLSRIVPSVNITYCILKMLLKE